MTYDRKKGKTISLHHFQQQKNQSANLKIKQAYILKQKCISYCQLKLQPSKYMLLAVSEHSIRKPKKSIAPLMKMLSQRNSAK